MPISPVVCMWGADAAMEYFGAGIGAAVLQAGVANSTARGSGANLLLQARGGFTLSGRNFWAELQAGFAI
jgi:hypothetical protein